MSPGHRLTCGDVWVVAVLTHTGIPQPNTDPHRPEPHTWARMYRADSQTFLHKEAHREIHSYFKCPLSKKDTQ